MSSSARLLVLTGTWLVFACGKEPFNPDRCNIRPAVISPDPARLGVGQTLILRAEVTPSTCLPSDAQPSNLRWRSDNPGVATVDAVTGRVTGIQPGLAEISLLTVHTQTLLTHSSVVVVGT
jgi:Big-like domain-containing protein